MSRPLIGQVLARMGKLSAIDIQEILAEQALTHRQFGQIALAWGLCDNENVCEAWCRQRSEAPRRADLDVADFDEQSLRAITPGAARRLGVIPLRTIGNELIVAAIQLPDSADVIEITRMAGRDVRFVLADERQVLQQIKLHYPENSPQAAA